MPRKEPLVRRAVRTTGELLITLGLVVMLFAGYEVYGKTWEINAEQGRLTQALDEKWDQAGSQTPVADDPIPGEGIARLHIPALAKKWVIVQGVALKDIKLAPGHYPDSQLPNEQGNFAVAGHRTPAIFWNLDKLTNGETIIVETNTDWYVYRVYSNEIVLPTKTDVVKANPDKPGAAPTRKILTLTTCNPKWDNYERLIVHAEQIRDQPKSQGRPSELGA
ncbi:MAG: class E sortase [Mycobacteriales bacterium]